MWTTVDLLRLMTASHLLVFTALLLRDHRRDRSAIATVFFVLCAACHLVQPVIEARAWPAPLVHAAVLGGVLVPAAFWVLTRVHFDDDCCLRVWHWAAIAAFEAVGYFACLIGREPDVAALPFVAGRAALWTLAPKLLSLVIIAHALFHVHAGSRADLVVSRLRLRYWILGLTGTYVLVERAARALAEGTSGQATVERLYAVSVFVFVFGVLVASTLVQPALLKPARPPAQEPVADPRLAEQLRRLVEVEQVFREEGLTIAALAARLGAHEHKVRQLVNLQLGFKNFNAFLHHYRLAEVQRALADPDKRHLTVAQVAFEVGYGSLGPFNRAFKEATGLTPTEFRAAHQADADTRVPPPSPPPETAVARPVAG
jgi:AraC-like DNA-binding protein